MKAIDEEDGLVPRASPPACVVGDPPAPALVDSVITDSSTSPGGATSTPVLTSVQANEVSIQAAIQGETTVSPPSPALGPPAFVLDHAKPLEATAFPDQPRQGRQDIPATIPNLRHMLKGYDISVRYDVVKKKLRIAMPGHRGTRDNADNTAMTQIISLAILNGLAVSHVPAYIEMLGDRNPYNPVAEWITGKPWDGQDRIPAIVATLAAQDGFPEELKETLIRKWLLSATAAAMKTSSFKARGVLTLQGPQGIGKTSWVNSLVSDVVLREMVIKVDHHLDGSNKDSILGAITHWIVEIGELDSSFKKDVARLKGFLTSDTDKLRRPYGRMDSEYPRRTVFFATVNDANFLVDSTGNTRFWTIPVKAIDFRHSINMQQVFAQLAVELENGSEWWLSESEEIQLESLNREHRAISVIRERLLASVDMSIIGDDKNPAKTALEVLTLLNFEHPTNPQCKECASILRELFGQPKKINGLYKWRIPLRKLPNGGFTSIEQEDDDDRY
ncbi:MAG: virulence-associated E family protein [Betaproteobacteria bacterium]|jgi:putative DNA primase/helicase|nr:virulence-associated E family protein [Betaproteobacteria bacterium]